MHVYIIHKHSLTHTTKHTHLQVGTHINIHNEKYKRLVTIWTNILQGLSFTCILCSQKGKTTSALTHFRWNIIQLNTHICTYVLHLMRNTKSWWISELISSKDCHSHASRITQKGKLQVLSHTSLVWVFKG